MSAIGAVSDDSIADCFLAMFDDHNRLFLEFAKKSPDGGFTGETMHTLIGSRYDGRPFDTLKPKKDIEKLKKFKKLTTYGLRLWKRGKHLGVHKTIEDNAVLLTMTLDPRRLMGLLYFGMEECHEHGDPKAIQERARIDHVVAEANKAEYQRAKAENRKFKPITAKKLGLKKPSPWKVYEQNGKQKAYRPSIAGQTAMFLCDKLSALDLSYESLSLREASMLLIHEFSKHFRNRVKDYMEAHGLSSKFCVATIEPHKRTSLPHVHMVFNRPYIAPIELLTEWWPWGSVDPNSSYGKGYRHKAKDAVSYATKYALKASHEAVHYETAVKRLKDGTEEQCVVEKVDMFYAYAWYYGIRLYNFSHNLPVERREPVWLCIGIFNGQTTHVFCRYRDDYKDSGTDWTESKTHDPPSNDGKRGWTLTEAQAFIEELCNGVRTNPNGPVNDGD